MNILGKIAIYTPKWIYVVESNLLEIYFKNWLQTDGDFSRRIRIDHPNGKVYCKKIDWINQIVEFSWKKNVSDSGSAGKTLYEGFRILMWLNMSLLFIESNDINVKRWYFSTEIEKKFLQ